MNVKTENAIEIQYHEQEKHSLNKKGRVTELGRIKAFDSYGRLHNRCVRLHIAYCTNTQSARNGNLSVRNEIDRANKREQTKINS